jgi:hypothetical protein
MVTTFQEYLTQHADAPRNADEQAALKALTSDKLFMGIVDVRWETIESYLDLTSHGSEIKLGAAGLWAAYRKEVLLEATGENRPEEGRRDPRRPSVLDTAEPETVKKYTELLRQLKALPEVTRKNLRVSDHPFGTIVDGTGKVHGRVEKIEGVLGTDLLIVRWKAFTYYPDYPMWNFVVYGLVHAAKGSKTHERVLRHMGWV